MKFMVIEILLCVSTQILTGLQHGQVKQSLVQNKRANGVRQKRTLSDDLEISRESEQNKGLLINIQLSSKLCSILGHGCTSSSSTNTNPTPTTKPTTTAEPTTTTKPSTTAEPTTTTKPSTTAEPTPTTKPSTTAEPTTTTKPTTSDIKEFNKRKLEKEMKHMKTFKNCNSPSAVFRNSCLM